MKLWIIYLFSIKIVFSLSTRNLVQPITNADPTLEPTPIVLWHGMGDTCCNSYSLGGFAAFLKKQIPGVYILSLKLGNSTIEDLESGYFTNPNKQVRYACKLITINPKLKNGFNAIGFSQGSQFLRAMVQRCGHLLPPVKNLISVGGQHQGIYGLPNCGPLIRVCDYLRKMLNFAAYEKWMQNGLVQATYWHDPLAEKKYQENSVFLSDINNELSINQTYIDNLNKLDKFVLVKFNNDSIVQPRESEWFGFYAPGQSKKLITLQESRIYNEDRLGLQKMDKENKLVFLFTDGDHLRFTDTWFIKNIIKPYLRNV